MRMIRIIDGVTLDMGTPEYTEENLSQCHLVHHKFQMDWPSIRPGLQ